MLKPKLTVGELKKLLEEYPDELGVATYVEVGEDMQNRSWERTLEEVDKCVLMCRVCHSVEHYGEY